MFIIDNNMEVNLSSACRLHWKFTSSFINHLLHARHSAGCWDTKKSVPQTLPLWSRWVSGQNRLYVVMTDRTEDLDMVHRRGGAQRRPLGSECRGCTGSFRHAGKLWLILEMTGHWVGRWRKSEGRGTTQQRQHVRPTEHRPKTASYLIQLEAI